jgi:hypothetical protein
MRLLPLSAASLAACALAALSLNGCPNGPVNPPDDGGLGCKLAYNGDKAADVELEVITLDPDYKEQALMDGGDASILVPPQGGRVIFAGVRAKNLDPCGVRLSGALRDTTNSEVRLDTRTVNLTLAPDGWSESDAADISSFSNIPVCSNTWASTDVFDQKFTLVISVKDRDGKSKQVEMTAVPRCDEKRILDGQDIQKECLCICKKDYVTGEPCGAGTN